MRTDGLPIVADPNDPVTYSRFDPIHVARTATTTEHARKAYADNADTEAAYLDGYLAACKDYQDVSPIRVSEGFWRGVKTAATTVFAVIFSAWMVAFIVGMWL